MFIGIFSLNPVRKTVLIPHSPKANSDPCPVLFVQRRGCITVNPGMKLPYEPGICRLHFTIEGPIAVDYE